VLVKKRLGAVSLRGKTGSVSDAQEGKARNQRGVKKGLGTKKSRILRLTFEKGDRKGLGRFRMKKRRVVSVHTHR